jgi:hypothetical protein
MIALSNVHVLDISMREGRGDENHKTGGRGHDGDERPSWLVGTFSSIIMLAGLCIAWLIVLVATLFQAASRLLKSVMGGARDRDER